MDTLQITTIIILVLLIIITMITLCMMYKNGPMLKTEFFESNHNCYPYTSDLPPHYSHLSKSKGWCTTGDYGKQKHDGDIADGESSIKCPHNHFKVDADDSHRTNLKAWCRKP